MGDQNELRSYVAQSHFPRIRRSELADTAGRARKAAEALTAEGTHVRHLRTTFIPSDETCMYLFEAASAPVVEEAMRRAAIATDRIVAAVEISHEK